MVREVFQISRTKNVCIIFFWLNWCYGSARFAQEVIIKFKDYVGNRKPDGLELRGNIKVLLATNRPDTLDPAMMLWCVLEE